METALRVIAWLSVPQGRAPADAMGSMATSRWATVTNAGSMWGVVGGFVRRREQPAVPIARTSTLGSGPLEHRIRPAVCLEEVQRLR
eukprot:9476679-Pyramimonas_sp.AAC.1